MKDREDIDNKEKSPEKGKLERSEACEKAHRSVEEYYTKRFMQVQ